MAKHLTKVLNEVAYEVGEKRQQQQPRLTMELSEFADKVGNFSELGGRLYESAKIVEIAKELMHIAENAEAYVLKEQGSDWFDGVTVKRNIKEMKGYVKEFSKVANEAHGLNQRLSALYEDCGRVLGRYFEINDGGDDASMGWNRSENDKIVNSTIGMKEAPQQRKKTYDFFIIPKGEKKVKHDISITSHSREAASAEAHRRYGSDKYIIRPVNEMKLKEGVDKYRLVLNEEVVTEYPVGNWVKLDVPEFKLEVAEKFEKQLKDQGYKTLRLDWVYRTVSSKTVYSEFFVPKEEFNEANDYAVKNYSFIKDSVPPGILVNESKKKELNEWSVGGPDHVHVGSKSMSDIKKWLPFAKRLGGHLTDNKPVRRPQGGEKVWQFKFEDPRYAHKFIQVLDRKGVNNIWIADEDEIVEGSSGE